MTQLGTNEAGAVAFLYAETPLHVGSGTGFGAIDLPIQRERMSRLPVLPGSGLKGALRESAIGWIWRDLMDLEQRKEPLGKDEERLSRLRRWADRVHDLFGPPPPDSAEKGGPVPSDFGGALSVHDARLLLFPVRSARGGWAWLTSPMCLDRLARDLDTLGMRGEGGPPVDGLQPRENDALVAPESAVLARDAAILEDLYFPAEKSQAVADLASWLRRALPAGEGYRPFAERLQRQLVVVHDSTMTELAERCTEVTTRVRLDPDTRTVKTGALWTEEALPAETLLWSPLLFSRLRRQKEVSDKDDKGQKRRPQTRLNDQDASEKSARDLFYLALGRRRLAGGEDPGTLAERLQVPLRDAECNRLRVGGDAGIGRGIVGLTLWAGEVA